MDTSFKGYDSNFPKMAASNFFAGILNTKNPLIDRVLP